MEWPKGMTPALSYSEPAHLVLSYIILLSLSIKQPISFWIKKKLQKLICLTGIRGKTQITAQLLINDSESVIGYAPSKYLPSYFRSNNSCSVEIWSMVV